MSSTGAGSAAGSWDGLIIGSLWPKCGHPRTAENTLVNGYERCRECHRARSRDYWLRLRGGVSRGVQNLRDAVLDQEALNADRAHAAELGGEFLRAINRWATLNRWRGA